MPATNWIAPEMPQDAVHTEIATGIDYHLFPQRIPSKTPGTYVLASDLADVLLIAYHGNKRERNY